MSTYDVASTPSGQDSYPSLDLSSLWVAPTPEPSAHDLDGLTQDAKADRFIAWSRELSGEQLHAVAQGLTTFEDRANLAHAVHQFSPPLTRSAFVIAMNDHPQTRPVWGAGQHPAGAPAAAAGGVGGAEVVRATAQRREFLRDPAAAAAPLIAQPILAFGVEGRRLATPAALTDTVALSLGLDPRPHASATLHATTQGTIVARDPRSGWGTSLQRSGGEGLDPRQQAACARVSGKLTELGGPAPLVHAMRVVYPAEGQHALASEALFRVEGQDGKPYLVDAQGAHYTSTQAYLSAPTRPQGVPIVMPVLDTRLAPVLGADAQPLAQASRATPGVLQSPVLQKVATGVTAGATAATLVFPPSAAITLPLLGGSGVLMAGQVDRMAWQWQHQRSDLDPLQNPKVLMDYASLALGGTGLARGAMAVGGATLARASDEVLNVAGNVMGVAEAGQAMNSVGASGGREGWADLGQAALDFAAGRQAHAAGGHVPKPGQPVPSVVAVPPASRVPSEPPGGAVSAPPNRKEQMWRVPEELRPRMVAAYERDVRAKAESLAARKAAQSPQTPEAQAAEAAYQRFLGGLDPGSRSVIENLNSDADRTGGPKITGPDSLVYRATNQRYLQFDTMTAKPNPNSSALVLDHGDLQPSAHFPCDDATEKTGAELGPGLNMSVKLSGGYLASSEHVVMAVKVGDLLARGGVFYHDVSAVVLIRPFYVTYQGEVPFHVVKPPPDRTD